MQSACFRLLEHVARAQRHADEHLDEVRPEMEERNLGFAGDGARSSVLPVPGPPTISTPRGCATQLLELGRIAQSTSSGTSSFASSQPATSAKVTVVVDSSSMRARTCRS
jgi:hypothetical protein